MKEVVQLVLKYGDRDWWLSYGMYVPRVFEIVINVLSTDGSDSTLQNNQAKST